MATLTGQQIDASYLGLLKTTDNAVIGVTVKALTDGGGNATNIEISNTATNFVSGTVDFTGSTVSGLPALIRAGSLTVGAFANSMRNITTTGGSPSTSDANGWESLAFGHGNTAQGARTVAIGIGSTAGDSSASTGGAVSIGWAVNNTGTRSVGIGGDNVSQIVASADDQVSIGSSITNSGKESVVIGLLHDNTGPRNVVIGKSCYTPVGGESVAIGSSTQVYDTYGIAIGSSATSSAQDGIAIGRSSNANSSGSIALGLNVTAGKADTVSVTELETQLAGGGITMVSPDGTEYKLTVANGGTLVIT